MRTIITFLLVITLFFGTSCSKSNDTTTTTPVKTKTQLLTAHPWKYDELFNNYGKTNAALVYKRGKPNNLFNLDIDKYTYNTNGTFNTTLLAAPYSQSGTWQFINSETQLQIQITGGGTYTGNIIKLDDDNYIFYDAASDSYGKLISY